MSIINNNNNKMILVSSQEKKVVNNNNNNNFIHQHQTNQNIQTILTNNNHQLLPLRPWHQVVNNKSLVLPHLNKESTKKVSVFSPTTSTNHLQILTPKTTTTLVTSSSTQQQLQHLHHNQITITSSQHLQQAPMTLVQNQSLLIQQHLLPIATSTTTTTLLRPVFLSKRQEMEMLLQDLMQNNNSSSPNLKQYNLKTIRSLLRVHRLNKLRLVNTKMVSCLNILEQRLVEDQQQQQQQLIVSNHHHQHQTPSSKIITKSTSNKKKQEKMNNSNHNHNQNLHQQQQVFSTPQEVARHLILNSLQRQKILDMDLRLIAKQIMPMWATRTWQDKSSILRQVLEWLKTPQSRPDLPLDTRVTLFIIKAKKHTKPSTQSHYASVIRSLASALGMELSTPVLNNYMKAMSAVSASSPIKHAQHFSNSQLEFMMSKALETSVPLALSIYLACKTASRWADIDSLTKEKIIFNHHQNRQLQPNEVVILWGTGLKTSRFKPFKATGYTVVQEVEHPQMMEMLKNHLKKMKSGAKLCPKTTQQMYKWLKKFPQTQNLSCHSFKVTQLSKLAELAVEGLLDPRLIPLVGKHQDHQLHHFPDSTIRYITKKVALAKMLGTQNATKLL